MNIMSLKDEKPTRLFLIRHGQVASSRQGKYNGHSDVKLSSIGIQQCQKLAERLSKEPVIAVYSSDLERCRSGAEIIAKTFGLTARPLRGLREKNFGKWEGLSPEEVARQFPDEWRQWLINPIDFSPSDGESYRDVYRRVLNSFTEILKTHEQKEFVIVSHGGVTRLIISYALQMDLEYSFRIEQKYGALNIIDFFQNVGTVKLINGP